MSKLEYIPKRVKISNTRISAKPGEGLISLPAPRIGKDAMGQRKIVWNIYKVYKKKEYYYHIRPFNRTDILVERDIDVSNALERVNFFNTGFKN